MKTSVAEQAEEITRKNVESVIELERELKKSRSTLMFIVDGITSFCGTMWFVWAHLIWFTAWISYGYLFAPQFDQYPFQLLMLIVSLEAILLSTFILISQNKDSQLAERRNHLILQIALLTEQENTKMLRMLQGIEKKLGIDEGRDPTIAALEQATSPASLVQQIDVAMSQR